MVHFVFVSHIVRSNCNSKDYRQSPLTFTTAAPAASSVNMASDEIVWQIINQQFVRILEQKHTLLTLANFAIAVLLQAEDDQEPELLQKRIQRHGIVQSPVMRKLSSAQQMRPQKQHTNMLSLATGQLQICDRTRSPYQGHIVSLHEDHVSRPPSRSHPRILLTCIPLVSEHINLPSCGREESSLPTTRQL